MPRTVRGVAPLFDVNYSMDCFPIEKIQVTDETCNSPLLKRAVEAWPEAVLEKAPIGGGDGLELSDDPVASGKKILALVRNRGKFIRKCPGTMGLVCCNYWVVDLVEGCAIDCSYCILQGYLNDRRIRLSVNFDDLEKELDHELASARGPVRLGTGELSDSLMFDHQLDLSTILINMIRKRPSATLELKTKTSNVDKLLSSAPAENVVIAWSLNSATVARAEEVGAAPVEERILAAFRMAQEGWKVAFHFDPLVIHPGWEKEYSRIISMLANKMKPEQVEWISMGALRFHPSMKHMIRRRFGSAGLLKGEFALCPDNKMRYVKPARRLLFDTVKSALEKALPGAPLYLCMEDARMWMSVFGDLPGKGPMKRLFA